MSDYAPRRAPANSHPEWWDSDGQHRVKIGEDGLFTPKNASEEEFATLQGWPHARLPKADTPANAEKGTE